MKLQKLLIVVLMSFLSVSCAKTSVTSAQLDSLVEVLYSAPIERPYTELGLVTTQTGQTLLHDRSTEGMLNVLQEKANELGADAIIVRSLVESTWGLKGSDSTGFERGRAEAIAIKFDSQK